MEKAHDPEAGMSKGQVFAHRIYGDRQDPMRPLVEQMFDILRSKADGKFKAQRTQMNMATGNADIVEVELNCNETIQQVIGQLEHIALAVNKMDANRI